MEDKSQHNTLKLSITYLRHLGLDRTRHFIQNLEFLHIPTEIPWEWGRLKYQHKVHVCHINITKLIF